MSRCRSRSRRFRSRWCTRVEAPGSGARSGVGEGAGVEGDRGERSKVNAGVLGLREEE